MTFLPIVERELRVAARKRFTFWSRMLAAGFALAIFLLLELLFQAGGGTFSIGQVEFTALRWLAFVFAALAGLFLTSDSLSEEIREGTLGLLFLTDLRGYDVVFGKLLTQSLRAFYALLAVFPIMGLALLAGGVTGAEFWRSVLVICNTLFFSLSLGMLVSSLSRDSTKAMNGTLLAFLLIFGGLPFVDLALAGFDASVFAPLLSLASPLYLFGKTGAYRFNEYWWCLIGQNALAWGFLLLASLRTPRSWQERTVATSASRPSLARRWRFGGARARLALRRRFLDKNPLLWLALRDRWLSRLVWTLTIITLLMRTGALAIQFHDLPASNRARANYIASSTNGVPPGGAVVYRSTNSSTNSFSSRTVVYSAGIGFGRPAAVEFLVQLTAVIEWLLTVALFLWVASQASRFFVDAAHNGAMELLLVTPINPAQIVRAQWRALCRTFWFPVACIVLLQVVSGVFVALQSHSLITYSAAAARAARAGAGGTTPYVPPDMTLYLLWQVFFGAVTTVAALVAVAWYGMWMGLTSRKTSVAVLKTICFVLVLPWIGLMFIRGFATVLMIPAGLTRNTTMFLLIPAICSGIATLCKDGIFFWWARLSLRVHFRDEITRDRTPRSRPPAASAPPPRPPPSAIAPPPIPPPIHAA